MGFEYRIRSIKHMTLREKLIVLRDKAGISQMSLAHQLDVSRQAVSRWESGDTTPSMDKLKALSYNEVKKLRALFAYAADCEPDGQGRILIPAKLREYAGLTREVVVIGSFDRAEIWDAERWAAVENDAFASGELESAMAEMGL